MPCFGWHVKKLLQFVYEILLQRFVWKNCDIITIMRTALYAGSFDPLTNGHVDVIETAAKIFDKVIVAVAYNSEKQGFLSVSDRVDLIVQTIKLDNVEVVSFKGLTVEYARKVQASAMVRGVRNCEDFNFEIQLAQNNRYLCNDIPTILIPTKAEHSYISSSAVREIFLNNGDITHLVPKSVAEYLGNK